MLNMNKRDYDIFVILLFLKISCSLLIKIDKGYELQGRYKRCGSVISKRLYAGAGKVLVSLKESKRM